MPFERGLRQQIECREEDQYTMACAAAASASATRSPTSVFPAPPGITTVARAWPSRRKAEAAARRRQRAVFPSCSGQAAGAAAAAAPEVHQANDLSWWKRYSRPVGRDNGRRLPCDRAESIFAAAFFELRYPPLIR